MQEFEKLHMQTDRYRRLTIALMQAGWFQKALKLYKMLLCRRG